MSQLISEIGTLNDGGGFDAFIESDADFGEVVGSPGDDQVTNDSSNVTSFGLGDGSDTYTGNNAEAGQPGQTSTVSGGSDNDILQAGLGEEADFSGGDGDDLLVGAQRNDTLNGDDGDDTLLGGTGNDTLSGGLGNDEMFGNRGRDTLTGEAGNDTLDGGADQDTLTGGPGADQFNFELLGDVPIQDGDDASDVFAGGEFDVITDFDPTEDTLAFDGDFFDNVDNFSVSEDGEGGANIAYDGSTFLNLEDVNPDDIDPDEFDIL
ncbi:Hemolysin-type calcium-binding region [Halothece sp. PCC 7418]|uniref:calcium-binding protein n=1 Tax=Halothece sp. (strain PCC 7418) TaxID=65093 RepID=UPI0002A05F75|nr:calcium-binding protein [Halothece sp. PCC 7418]AFZ45415.1 Hemolysin-type calcium-binding region [Halothece sp. PCC 7418]